MKLSQTEICSWCGNVVPLWLSAGSDLRTDPPRWHAGGDCIALKHFSPDPHTDGVLVTLLRPGEDCVRVELGGEQLTCRIHIRPRRTEAPDAVLHAWPADLHIHTTTDHNAARVAACNEDLPTALLQSQQASHAIACGVISDHAAVTNPGLFYRGFCAEETVSHVDLVVFPGTESEAAVIERDRYGLEHKNAGEMVVLNAAGFTESATWEDFLTAFEDSPFAVGILSHPYVFGFSQRSIWDHCFEKNAARPELRRLVHMVEMDNGTFTDTRPLYQYAYSRALDCGFRLAPCCNSDSHGPYAPCPGKTMLLSSAADREMFYDAFTARRVYACQSGAVELHMTVNGCGMGETLPPAREYRFAVRTEVPNNAADAAPVRCEVISDYGLTVWDAPFDHSAAFTLPSDTARYFYLRLTDAAGRFTWSAPVWTGRAFDELSALQQLTPLDKTGFTAWDETHGCDAGAVVCDDPRQVWQAPGSAASLLIDMGGIRTIRAVGHIAPPLQSFDPAAGISLHETVMHFLSGYRISASTDGEHFTHCRSGIIRNFGGEELLTFAPIAARWLRFEALGTTGGAVGGVQDAGLPVRIGELSVFA